MKRLFTVLMVVLSFSAAKAQMPDGSIAPDWTMTDIDGVSHNLYSYLDQGYVVFLDFSATWCGPCWNYHNSNAFKDLYNMYGPGTADDKVMVFMIEGDQSTTPQDLVGTGSNTLGDWTAGVPYPIIDDHAITSTYQIGYWPTIYKICPSRVITEVGQQNVAGLWAAAQEPDCQAASQPVDAIVQGYSGETSMCGVLGAQMSVDIMNFGMNPLTAADINIIDNGTTIHTESWTGNLATYGAETVDLGGFNLAATSTLTFEVVAAGDANTANNSITQDIVVAPEVESTVIDIQIQTDQYGYETYWAIIDDAGNVATQADGTLAQGGNFAVGLNGGGQNTATPSDPGAYGNNALINETVSLPGQPNYMCYQFVIVDSYGDGMCCDYGNGFYNVLDLSNAAAPLLFTGGSFTTSEGQPFYKVLNSNTQEVAALNEVKIFPNPASTNVNVQLNLETTSEMGINITNTLGQTVKFVNTGNLNAGQHNFNVNTSDLAAGMYFINFTDGANVITKRLVVAK